MQVVQLVVPRSARAAALHRATVKPIQVGKRKHRTMSENNEVQETRSVDDVLHGGGGPKVFAFDEVGYRITGTLKSAEMVAVRYPKDHPQAGEHKRYSKGRLAYQIKLVLTDTDDERADDEDDGTRRAFVKEFGDNRDAFAKALDERS